ncbi:MAG TPA: phytochelatin synthase family protein [Xanthobacteraceae bacterium]|nr:phytochelatin synthase family protein [Xanthobacteraceae bacterium]
MIGKVLRAGVVMLLVAAATLALADDPQRKFGPGAVPIGSSHDYLREQPAPDFWALSPYYEGQSTDSACSLAAVAMLVNALRGLPPLRTDPLVTQQALLTAVASPDWAREAAAGGSGVTWRAFVGYVSRSLEAYGLDAEIEVLKPADTSPATLSDVRQLLADNERSDRDIVLAYFNQGVLTGDWDGPHISPIGAYDAARRSVLIMDVDRQWYVPYWSSDEKLVEAMLRPTPNTFAALARETGGLVRVRKR